MAIKKYYITETANSSQRGTQNLHMFSRKKRYEK